MKTRHAVKASFHADKRKRKIFILFVIGFLVVTLVAYNLYYVTHLEEVRITKIHVHGNETLSNEEIVPQVERYLAGSYVGLLARDNAYMYPRRQIQRSLLGMYPEMKTLVIERYDPHTLTLTFEERSAEALYCGKVLPPTASSSQQNEQCYFLDDGGLIYSKAASFSEKVFVRYYGKTNQDSERIRRYREFFSACPMGCRYEDAYAREALRTIIDALQRMEITVVQAGTLGKGDAFFKTSQDVMIYLALSDDLTKVVSNFRSALNTEAFGGSLLFDPPLEYVDLRFGNKVFFKQVQTEEVNEVIDG